MQIKTARMLVKAQADDYEPNDDHRRMVRLHSYNGLSLERIAEILQVPAPAILVHYRRELQDGEDTLLAYAAQTVMTVAGMTETHPEAALKAANLMLQSRKRNWRIPKEEPAPPQAKRLEDMGLKEIDERLAQLRAALGGAAPAGAEAQAAGSESEPDGMV